LKCQWETKKKARASSCSFGETARALSTIVPLFLDYFSRSPVAPGTWRTHILVFTVSKHYATVIRQRDEYEKMVKGKDTTMTKARIDELSALGFDWTIRPKLTFDERAGQWLDYRTKNGRDPPVNRREWTDELTKTLACWVAKTRGKYELHQEGKRSNTLTQERIDRLTRWGFVWEFENDAKRGIRRMPWDEYFQKVVEFKAEHGHTKIPFTVPELGPWVYRQRRRLQAFHRGEKNYLSAEQAAQLDGINFWYPKTRVRRSKEAIAAAAAAEAAVSPTKEGGGRGNSAKKKKNTKKEPPQPPLHPDGDEEEESDSKSDSMTSDEEDYAPYAQIPDATTAMLNNNNTINNNNTLNYQYLNRLHHQQQQHLPPQPLQQQQQQRLAAAAAAAGNIYPPPLQHAFAPWERYDGMGRL
jgi:Helicase associated domain